MDGWTTQAVEQQHTSPLRAGCEARRREIFVIFGCGNGLARDAPGPVRITGRVLMTAATPRSSLHAAAEGRRP